MKTSPVVNVEALQLDRDRWDTAIEWLMIILLGFMPLAFGAVEPWSEMITFLLVGVISVCFALKYVLSGGFRLVWTWAYVPLLLLLLLTLLQLLPLPNDWMKWLSPHTLDTKTSLLGAMAKVSTGSGTTLSFYPYATKHDLRLFLVAMSVFIVVANIYRHPSQIKRLLGAIAAIGFGFALLALVQIITGATAIYWSVETTQSGVMTAGSFVNHSHYAQFMNLSIGAALALLLVRMEETTQRQRLSASFRSFAKTIRQSSAGWLMAMIILGGITVFTSLSRNGVISMVVAATFTGIMLSLKRKFKWRGWLLGFLPFVVLAGLLFVGFDIVYERLAKIQEIKEDLRWEMTLGALDAWRDYPVWGTGLGTHEMVFPMYDRATLSSVAAHADNDYAQLLEETGLVGATMVGLFLLGFWWRFGQLVRKGTRSLSMSAFGLGFGILAIMIHSVTDFGQHLPANFCLSAIACGLMVAIARMERLSRSAAVPQTLQRKHPRMQWLVAAAISCGLAGGWCWILWKANSCRVAERHWGDALVIEFAMRQNYWKVSDEDYADLIRSFAAAAESDPENVKYRYWLNLYRWYSISRVIDPETGQVVMHPKSLRFAERIAAELSQARLLCPTYGPAYSVEGQLRLFFLDQSQGADLIRKGYQLAPYDASTCFIAGILAAQENKLKEASERFKRAIDLDGTFYREIMPIYIDELNRPDLVRELATDDPQRLLQLSKLLAETKEHALLAEVIQADAVAILCQRCESGSAKAGELATLAAIYQKNKKYAEAVDYYRRALALDYGQVSWRFNLAKNLAELGQTEDAIHEARICLRLSPEMKSAKNLIGDLSIRAKP